MFHRAALLGQTGAKQSYISMAQKTIELGAGWEWAVIYTYVNPSAIVNSWVITTGLAEDYQRDIHIGLSAQGADGQVANGLEIEIEVPGYGTKTMEFYNGVGAVTWNEVGSYLLADESRKLPVNFKYIRGGVVSLIIMLQTLFGRMRHESERTSSSLFSLKSSNLEGRGFYFLSVQTNHDCDDYFKNYRYKTWGWVLVRIRRAWSSGCGSCCQSSGTKNRRQELPLSRASLGFGRLCRAKKRPNSIHGNCSSRVLRLASANATFFEEVA